MRNDVLMRLVRQAMEDAAFRNAAQADLEGTLRAHGYRLEPDELAAVREFHARMAGLSSKEVSDHLLKATRGESEEGGGWKGEGW